MSTGIRARFDHLGKKSVRRVLSPVLLFRKLFPEAAQLDSARSAMRVSRHMHLSPSRHRYRMTCHVILLSSSSRALRVPDVSTILYFRDRLPGWIRVKSTERSAGFQTANTKQTRGSGIGDRACPSEGRSRRPFGALRDPPGRSP